MKIRRLHHTLGAALAVSAAAALLTLQSGCIAVAAAGAGAAGVAYVKGDLRTTVAHHVEHVTNATEQAISQMQLVKLNESRDSLSASFTVRTADDKKVEIKLTRQSDDATQIDIRAGLGVTHGDEELARHVLDRIQANL